MRFDVIMIREAEAEYLIMLDVSRDFSLSPLITCKNHVIRSSDLVQSKFFSILIS